MHRTTPEHKALKKAERRERYRIRDRKKWAKAVIEKPDWFLRKKEQNKKYVQKRKLLYPEKKKAVDAAWRLKNIEHCRLQSRLWKQRNWARHKFLVKKALAKYNKTEKGRVKNLAAANRRRARMAGVKSEPLAVQEYMRLMRSMDFVNCEWCSLPVKGPKICFDHVVPIVKGGDNTVENLVPTCKRCNSSKNAKLLSQWTKRPFVHLGFAGCPFGWSPAKEVEYNRYWGKIPWNTPIPEGERTFKIVSA